LENLVDAMSEPSSQANGIPPEFVTITTDAARKLAQVVCDI